MIVCSFKQITPDMQCGSPTDDYIAQTLVNSIAQTILHRLYCTDYIARLYCYISTSTSTSISTIVLVLVLVLVLLVLVLVNPLTEVEISRILVSCFLSAGWLGLAGWM